MPEKSPFNEELLARLVAPGAQPSPAPKPPPGDWRAFFCEPAHPPIPVKSTKSR